MCMRIVDAILESSDKKKSTFLEEVGIETDEDSGVSMPTMWYPDSLVIPCFSSWNRRRAISTYQ